MLHSLVVSILTVVISICAKVHSQTNCSDTVGSVSLTLRLDSIEYINSGGAFLNLNETATCGGPVMGWRFCYYVREGFNDTDVDAPFQVGAWRPVNNTAYQLINESFQPLPISPPSNGIQFVCQQWLLPSELQFSIEAGSVVGVYFSEATRVSHVITKERTSAVTYFRGGGIEDVYFIPLGSLVEMSGFALYIEALMGNGSSTSTGFTESPTTAGPDMNTTTDVLAQAVVPLWAISTLCVLGAVSMCMAFALGVMMYKYSRSYKKKIRLGTESGQISGLRKETEMQDFPQHIDRHSQPPTPQIELETTVDFTDSRTDSNIVLVGKDTTPRVGGTATNTHRQKVRSKTAFSPVSKKNQQFKERRSERIVTNKKKHFDEINIANVPVKQTEQDKTTRDTNPTRLKNVYLQPPTKQPIPLHTLSSPSSNHQRNSLRRSISDIHLLVPHKEDKLKVSVSHNKEDELVSSVESDYPYVIHTCEVLGHQALRSAHSLPNLLSSTGVHSSSGLSSSNFRDSVDSYRLSKFPQPYLEYEPVYSYPYDFTPPPGLSFVVDRRGRKFSIATSSHRGMQLKELREERTTKKYNHSSKEKVTSRSEKLSLPQTMWSPEYVEIPDVWISPREKPMPLPRKFKHSNQSSESSHTYLSYVAIETRVNGEVRTSVDGEDDYTTMSSPDYLPLIPSSKEDVDDIYTVPSYMTEDYEGGENVPSHMTEENEDGENVYDVPPDSV